MKLATVAKMQVAWEWCNAEDKSTEFLLQFMADIAGVSHEQAVAWFTACSDAEKAFNESSIPKEGV